ncbi:MAG TPA: gliding motility-associated C-terminal domain-containing protein [Cyclobacteriaceae bacterium]|nr:gliding motility-associated C-terminal domain-containing protein [Cyclobacteriaceae bacterium]HRJ80862.1 gliding motility-associated C-terminal domain-containing protein [Cyclobacteriaceae bacterium]
MRNLLQNPKRLLRKATRVVLPLAPVMYSFLASAQGILLNGATDFVQVTDHPALRPSSLTLEAQINFSSLAGIYQAILGKGYNTAGSLRNSYALWYQDGSLRAGIDPSNLAYRILAPWSPLTNQWYHVAYTYDHISTVQNLYIDGVLVASGNAPLPIYDSDIFAIGVDRDFGVFQGFFNGRINEVRLWDFSRTQANIAATMNTSLIGNEPGLVAYYRLNEAGQGEDITVANSATATGAGVNGITVGTTCSPIFTILAPSITSFSPASGPIGTTVTITGTNFSNIPANNLVKFNGLTAVVSASTITSIITQVPAGTTTGFIEVTVGCHTTVSGSSFTITTVPPVITAVPLSILIGGIVTVDLIPLITTSSPLDMGSLQIVTPPVSGAPAVIDANGILTINYTGFGFTGTDVFTLRACDALGRCTDQQFEVEVVGEIIVYNAISPNNDDKNDFFYLQYIELFPETQQNTVQIFNRWGDVVWETENYNNTTRVFSGTTKNGNELPTGTYFFKIAFQGGTTRTGFLSLKR